MCFGARKAVQDIIDSTDDPQTDVTATASNITTAVPELLNSTISAIAATVTTLSPPQAWLGFGFNSTSSV